MTTTRTYLTSSAIGADSIKESIAAYLGDSDMDLDETLRAVQLWVNRELPGTFAWFPYLSEVHASVDEAEELTEEDLMTYIDQGIAECAVDPDEDTCGSLTDAQRHEVREEICEETGTDPEDYQLDEVMQLDRRLVKQLATIKEYKRAFRKFYGGE